MIQFNFTLVVEMVLFLVFLWVTNKFMFRPVRRVMDERDAKIGQDKSTAAQDAAEAQHLESQFIEQLTQTDQAAAQRLRQARYEAYQHNRAELEALRHQADADVGAFRDAIERQVAEERQKYAELIPGLVESMDRQLRTEGSLR